MVSPHQAAIQRSASAGFSLLEVLFTVAVMSFLFFSTNSLHFQLKDQQVRSANLSSVGIFKGNLASVTLDQTSWQNTLKANSASGLIVGSQTLRFAGNMDCLVNSTVCNSGSRPFALIDGAGRVVYDGTNPYSGLNYDGTTCNADCPMKFNLQWEPVCPLSGTCVVSQVSVQAAFVINAKDFGPANPARYSLSPAIIRNSK
jgi:type II secretory pathway pseudopilin PulG